MFILNHHPPAITIAALSGEATASGGGSPAAATDAAACASLLCVPGVPGHAQQRSKRWAATWQMGDSAGEA